MGTAVSPPAHAAPVPTAPTERGWWKLIVALFAFLAVPMVPQARALIPIDQPLIMFVTALAVCTLVGWRVGGRPLVAIAAVAVAAVVVVGDTTTPLLPFQNLVRGWSLLLAGAFGLVSLVGVPRTFFSRALVALGATIALALVMSFAGSVTVARAQAAITGELARRNDETMAGLTGAQWKEFTTRFPQLAQPPDSVRKQLEAVSGVGLASFPALLALESLAALGLAWSTYHRIARARLGAPLSALREFRFNDGLVWGLIAGLLLIILPEGMGSHGLGTNLLVFFGTLYTLRGLGILTFFVSPRGSSVALAIGFVALVGPPELSAIVVLVFLMLGVGDTWVDWRSRARSTT